MLEELHTAMKLTSEQEFQIEMLTRAGMDGISKQTITEMLISLMRQNMVQKNMLKHFMKQDLMNTFTLINNSEPGGVKQDGGI